MNLTRRTALLSAAALPAILAGCGSSTAVATEKSIVSTAQTILNAVIAYTPTVQKTLPKLLPDTSATPGQLSWALLTTDEDAAKASLTALQTSLANPITAPSSITVATVIQTGENFLTMFFTVLQPVIPALTALPGVSTAAGILQDAILAWPIVEGFINEALNLTTTPAAALAAKTIVAPNPQVALAHLKAAGF